eukprot:s498_g30.t1
METTGHRRGRAAWLQAKSLAGLVFMGSGPGFYNLPRLFDAPSRVLKKTQKLPAYFEDGRGVKERPGPAAYVRLPKVITEDAPDNTDWEDVQDTTEAWFVQSYTTPVPTLSDDQMAEIDEIVGGL